MRNLKNELKKREISCENLLEYGFCKSGNSYLYKHKICDNQFEMIVQYKNNEITSKLIDLLSEEEYVLVDVQEAVGEFIGTVRKEYENKLNDILNKCTIKSVFKNTQTKQVIEYIKEKYGDELEFLWEKFDDNAIWRNKDNQKWYGVLMTISRNKLGIDSEKITEIIDLRYQKEEIENIIDNVTIYPGYHMNKKSWITIELNNSIDKKKLFELIDNSHNLSVGNKCGLAGNSLSQKIYDYLTTIPKGKVVTYKQVAEHIGNKGLARAVGNILHKNPDENKYPCYKVLNSKGELAEAFVFGGKEVQKERLEKDGIKVVNNKVDLSIYQWIEQVENKLLL